MSKSYLAVDLGAESGRVLLGTVGSGRLQTHILHRFPTRGLRVLGTWQWDITRIFAEIVEGLRLAAHEGVRDPAGIGIDTWGVDYGLIAADGTMLGNPIHYRDTRTAGMMNAAYAVVPHEAIYHRTGITSHPFNTLYQLFSMSRAASPILDAADRMLFIGPLLGYFLTGCLSCEYTIASTSQMLSIETGDWDRDLLARLAIPGRILLDVTAPGSVVGAILPEIAQQTGLFPSVPYLSTAIHDTASAVVAVPAESGGDWAYLSSGTWSLLGAELTRPLVTDEARTAGFTNEGGVSSTIRFLKNIFGLWLVQECRRAWVASSDEDDESISYANLTAAAAAETPFRTVIDIDDPRLLAPENMPAMLATLCREQNRPLPETHAQYVRCALESLALMYRRSLRRMDAMLGRTTKRLHIIGGGVQNELLCQMTADACGIPVHAGPVEATSIGNLAVQAMATGQFSGLDEARRVIRESSDIRLYKPRNTSAWDALDK